METGTELPAHDRLERVGRGMHATVYKVRLEATGEVAALRYPNMRALASGPTLRLKRSQSEFPEAMACWQTLSEVDSVVTVLDMGMQPRPWVLLEFLDGTLAANASDCTVPERGAMLAAVARAISGAHRRNIAHVDVKPANVLLTSDGEAKLGDWGEAYELEPGTADAQAAMRRDVRDFALMAYELLTGVELYDHQTEQSLDDVLETTSLSPPSELQQAVPDTIDRPILDALSPSAKERPRRIDPLREALADGFSTE